MTSPAPPAARFHRLTVGDVRRETADAVSIAFLVPDEVRREFEFSCGQYLTLKTQVGGADVRRSYSICSGVDDGEIRVAIKRVDGGLFSRFACETITTGDTVEVMPPMGRFTVAPAPMQGRAYAAFAAGSGITPILSIIKTLMVREPQSRFFLFYGNRSTGTILFREALDDLKDRYIERLSIFHVLSREKQDIDVFNGRLDRRKVETLMRALVPAEAIDEAFVCGPATMIDEVQAALLGLGMHPDKIHTERFTPADDPLLRGREAAAAPTVGVNPAGLVTVITGGVASEVPIRDGESILDAALSAGVDLPYSCRGGMCCTCRAKLVNGAVDMTRNYSLERWELEAGFVLTCQSHPTTATVTVDFDQV